MPPPASAEGDPVLAKSDAELRALATARGWPGLGTAASPILIEGLELTATSAHGIELQKTRLHVLIRDVAVIAGGSSYDGIRLVDAQNVTIERADLQFDRTGVHVEKSSRIAVRNSTIRTSQTGILLDQSTGGSFEGNSLAVNDRSVKLKLSPKHVFRGNNVSIASQQTGFEFLDETSYNNSIDASNVVNFVPVRWYTSLYGTAAAPRVVSGVAAQVKGMTNVAQVMCFDCRHVRMEGINASAGAASGLVLVNASGVALVSPIAEANDAAGIELRNAQNVTVTGASANGNKVGILARNATNAQVTGAALLANGQGVLVQHGRDNAILSSRVESNDDGIVLDATNRTRTEGNTLASNKVDGLRIAGGRDNLARNENATRNGGSGVTLSGTQNATVTGVVAEGNAKAGITIASKTLLSKVSGNVAQGNGEAGIRLTGAGPLNRLEDNDLANQTAQVRFTLSEQSILDRNRMTVGRGQTGLVFDDEASYQNNVSTTNLVNGTPVRWYVALVGTATSPIVLRDIEASALNITNVAQVMVYKGSYVRLEDVDAAHGARGVYVLRSSSITLQDARTPDNGVGVELRGTLTADVEAVDATGSRIGLLLAETSNASVDGVKAPGARVAVEFADKTSKGAVVQNVDATGVLEASVRDPSIVPGPPARGNHLIADAGLDKTAGAGKAVNFTDAIGVARFGSERIVKQAWSFGDGGSAESDNDTLLRPSHNYSAPGNYTATYRIETADGLELEDTVRVTVLAPPASPSGVTGAVEGRRVTLEWRPPMGSEVPGAYRVYRGTDPDNLTFLMEVKTNKTILQEKVTEPTRIWYAVTAIGVGGESAQSAPAPVGVEPPPEAPTDGAPTTTTPTEEAATPGVGVLALLGAVGAVALLARRKR